MWKKFNQIYQKLFIDQKVKRQEALEVKNHIVTIKGNRYFFAKAMVTDVPEVTKVENEADREIPWTEDQFDQDVRQKQSCLYLVLRRHDKMVAFIGCRFDYQKQICDISNVMVLPEYQGKGLGYFLVEAIINKSRCLELSDVVLNVRDNNQKVINLCQDLSFKQTRADKEEVQMVYSIPQKN